jgi:hypothetical protein
MSVGEGKFKTDCTKIDNFRDRRRSRRDTSGSFGVGGKEENEDV